MGKYFDPARNKDGYVYLRLMDENEKVFHDFKQVGCHGVIINNMDKRAAVINVYRKKVNIPYNLSEIKRWIDDLNEMGFPCKLSYDEDGISDEAKQVSWIKDTVSGELCDLALLVQRHGSNAPVDPTQFYNFYVYLKDYNSKNHLFSTLQLIRCLNETTLSRIPEMYFERLDADPGLDKFEVLQDCHKGDINGYSHAVTYKGNGKNISHKAIMERFKVKTDLYSGRPSINQAWNGG